MAQVETATPGWYPYPGDPPGTVRRWSGSEWIGFPTDPPPGTPGYQAPTRSYAPRPFRNQKLLAPYAVPALVGLLATIVAGLVIILELLSILDRIPNPTALTLSDEPLLRGPSHHAVVQLFLVGLFAGGIAFLVWLWRANENIGSRRRRLTYRSGGHHFLMWIVIGWAYVMWLMLRPIFGPVVNSMFNCIERSGTKGTPGSWALGVAWWILWMASSVTMVLTAMILWSDSSESSTGMRVEILAAAGALGAHITSLAIAAILVVLTTARQDQRLRR